MLVELEQSTPEWHLWRKSHITASMSPVIMGVSKWMTPYQLFCEITGLTPPRESTAVMQKGLELEPIARAEAEMLLGLDIKRGAPARNNRLVRSKS